MAKNNLKKVLQAAATSTREFNYMLGDVNLKFSLRTDIKQQLKDFSQILERALEDVKAELAKK